MLQKPASPGFVFISTHARTLDQLKDDAVKPLDDGQGTSLQLTGNLETLSANSIGGNYQGLLEGSPAKCYIVGIANPFGGLGVSILAASEPGLFSEELQQTGQQLASSFEFKKVDRTAEIEEWLKFLSGMRLTYLESYNSPSYSGGISGGYDIKRVIDLCPQGFYTYGSNSNILLNGAVSGNQQGSGKWSIVLGTDAYIHLQLEEHSGETRRYRLEYIDQKLYLNGERYFRTNDEDNSPVCD
ncbi:hypothetical protein J0A68_07210 [Algoriphagus sp. H41]|uniref:Uncharacterized protein n=1 Tax=Algoriphagus oliviformis TaxID=2811231 RepID=A0ABS3C3L8_9BACT|nr:hypothetical protein [Algoriphagus oliviformis]MBN7810736.1 hypothetical protein [Algoriphagus oliviformis]